MKITSSAIAIVATITLLGGCLSLPNVADMTPQQFKDLRTSVSRDDFEKTTRIETSRIYFSKGPLPLPREAYYLIATKKDGAEISYRLMLYSENSLQRGGRPICWERAADQEGNNFSLESNGVSVFKTLIDEWSSAQVSREYLEGIRKTGTTWRFYGRVTTTALIQSQAIDGFLMKVDEVFKESRPSGYKSNNGNWLAI
ncbi:MAG: hypothetical protein LBM92_04800 [Opitutaceae bacterium]|jgi:hypothetical protein|nr:hypothetical protein [Opitutaceae bacterium]